MYYNVYGSVELFDIMYDAAHTYMMLTGILYNFVFLSGAPNYFTPSFDGLNSYMELKRIHHANRDVTIEMTFNPLSSQGILFFIGGSSDMTGDFISITLNDSIVEFR